MASKRKFGAQRVVPPDGRLRQSQVVSTFGPGSMLDLTTDSVVVGGLDFWRLNGEGVVVSEPRLLEAIEPLFFSKKWRLSKDTPFRKPPPDDERAPSESNGIQMLEFPH